MGLIQVIDAEPLDSLAVFYRSIRDISKAADVSTSEVIAVLELVKHEFLADHMVAIHALEESR